MQGDIGECSLVQLDLRDAFDTVQQTHIDLDSLGIDAYHWLTLDWPAVMWL